MYLCYSRLSFFRSESAASLDSLSEKMSPSAEMTVLLRLLKITARESASALSAFLSFGRTTLGSWLHVEPADRVIGDVDWRVKGDEY